ncbi:MAG: helix-turn-helix domain-containing protein [Oscillospiraceae bacterium]|nr:helix-turn-helix domain-containing protein [Oscillospiraceae bacterium]
MCTEIYQYVLKKLPDLLTVNDLSGVLGVSTKTCYQLLHEGKIKHIKIGRFFRIPKLNLLKYLGLMVA